jgi:hypothetical protein
MVDPTAIVEAFATWAKRRGIPGRSVEHRRTAKELLILSSGQRPTQEHVDQLAADYRDAFHAPNQIVVAREIAAALRQWAGVEGAAHFGAGEQILPPLDHELQPPLKALELELPKQQAVPELELPKQQAVPELELPKPPAVPVVA